MSKKTYIYFKLEGFKLAGMDWLPLKKDTRNHIIAVIIANNAKEATDRLEKHIKENANDFDKGFDGLNWENVMMLECKTCKIAVQDSLKEDLEFACNCCGSIEILD